MPPLSRFPGIIPYETSALTWPCSTLAGGDVSLFRLHVLPPGEPNGLYHSESEQEAFLVLSGECRLLVEGEERLLRSWDFFHSPAGTEHIFVGAGDGPCVILMAGARSENWQVLYPVSELAARYGASAEEETSDPRQAYVGFEPSRRARPSYWDRLPWA